MYHLYTCIIVCVPVSNIYLFINYIFKNLLYTQIQNKKLKTVFSFYLNKMCVYVCVLYTRFFFKFKIKNLK